MAVGTTADFDVTRDELIDLSLSRIGVTEPAQTDRTLGRALLGMLVRSMDVEAKWLHAISNTASTLTLIGGQQAYAAGTGASLIATNILRLEYAAVLINGEREPLTILDKETALRTTLQDDSPAEPEAVYLEQAKLRSAQRMLFYPTPNSAYSIVYHYKRTLFDFDLATDNPDMNAQFVLALYKKLAVELAPHYGYPAQEHGTLIQEAEFAWQRAKSGSAERQIHKPVKAEYM